MGHRASFLSVVALATLALALPAWVAQPSVPIVSTAAGRVSGISEHGAHAWLGIPYGASTAGENRWKPPMKVAPWRGVRDGSTFGPSCYQTRAGRFGPYTPEFMMSGPISEDCLSLNVWAPASGGTRLPVLVWIHGGGFGGGSGGIVIYNGARLAAKGAVVVTINYRVGVFGFLAHPELAAESPRKTSGNYGLLDMIAALQWVKANIAAFGGDPARVTVAGQSAGAMAINDLLLSNDAKGLFAGAIAHSGTAANPAVISSRETAEQRGRELLQAANAASIKALRGMDADAVLAAATPPPAPGMPPQPRMVPNLDGVIVTGDPNRADAPVVVKVPVISGYNHDEGRVVSVNARSTPAEFEKAVRERFGAAAERVLAMYPHATDAEASASANQLPRDVNMTTLALWAQARSKVTGAPNYIYQFVHVYPGPESDKFGTFHTAEVPYLFGVLDQQGRPFNDADRRVSEQLQQYWLNFMRAGSPGAAGSAAWTAATAGAPQVMGLGDVPGMRPTAGTAERTAVLRDIVLAEGFRPVF